MHTGNSVGHRNVGRAAVQGILSIRSSNCRTWYTARQSRRTSRAVRPRAGRGPHNNDVDAILALSADCVVYSPCCRSATNRAVARSGKERGHAGGIGSTVQHARGRRARSGRAAPAGVSLPGTGIHRGASPSCAADRVTAVPQRASRPGRGVLRHSRLPRRLVVREVMLVREPPEERRPVRCSTCWVWLGQSIDMLAAGLGCSLDAHKATTHEMAVATAPIERRSRARPGHGGGTAEFCWQAWCAANRITVRVNWLMGERHLDPPWTIGGERVEVEVRATRRCTSLPRPATAVRVADSTATRASSHGRSTA